MKPLQKDQTGNSAVSLLIIIAVVLVVWQFILPSYGYASLSDTIGATDPEPEAITFAYGLSFNGEPVSITDTVADYSGVDRLPSYYPAYDIDDDNEIPDYVFTVQTNAPSRVSSPYTIRVKSVIYEGLLGDVETETSLLYVEINAFSGSGVKTFNVPFDNSYISQTINEYTDVIAVLYEPSGLVIDTLHLVIV